MNIKDRLHELDRWAHKPPASGVPAAARLDATSAELFAEISRTPPVSSPPWETTATLKQLASNGCFLVEWRLPLSQLVGDVALHELQRLSGKWLAVAGKDKRLAALESQRALFVDCETTGLAGGTGTVAFLIGVGFVSADDFVIRQYFVRHFRDEATTLHELAQQVGGASGLVTFNGRAFDIPLLNSRYILNRRQPVFEGLPHFDLLFAARRIWRDQVTPCSLGELEKCVLGIQRLNDLPGSLVPQIYFEFLRSGTLSGLGEVFLHNRRDILSMATLLIRLCRMVEEPLVSTSASERRRLASLFRKAQHLEQSIELLESLIAREPSLRSVETYAELALCYNRLGRHDDACRLWQRVVDECAFHPLPYIELAKHYEHRLRDVARALALTDRALRALTVREELAADGKADIYRFDLEKRWRRLRRKQNGQEKWRSH